MKKRIQRKKQKNKNLNRQNKILKQISHYFTIENKTFGDGYFLFAMGKSSVCHFTLKETPDWTYGIWLKEQGYYLFGEYDDFIDKFKPSRTYVNTENDVQAFIDKVNVLQEDPILAIVDAMTGSALVPYVEHESPHGNWYTGYQVVRKYNEQTDSWDIYKRDESITQEDYVQQNYEKHVKEKVERKKDDAFDRKLAFDFFKNLAQQFKEIQAVGVEDKNLSGWFCYPRYQLKLIVDENCTKEKMEELFRTVNQLVHEKNYSDEMKFRNHTFDLDEVTDDPQILRYCHYQYKKTS